MQRKNNLPSNPSAPYRAIVLTILSIVLFTTCTKEQEVNQFTQSEYWKNQTLTAILPPWTDNAVDSINGSFFCNLDGNWKPVGEDVKFPSMIARHLFSYSSAYLMSGDDQYLTIAREIKAYLFDKAWDNEYGGWFDALSADGKPWQEGKSTFVQVYVITGLTLYYFVTHDQEVLDYINRSNELLEKNAWDQNSGGYYDALQRNWAVSSEVKSVSSQLAPVSGYLLYLYMATRDKKYLDQAERICDTIIRFMVDTKSGWILENFDKNWNYMPGRQNEEEINVGHNIEVAWSLLRLYLLNNRTDYLQAGKTLTDSLHHYGFNSNTGFWAATIGNENPRLQSNYTYWWIQAYGNMFDLYLNRVYGETSYLNGFSKGAAFWETYFLDKDKGDTHLSVLQTGEVKEAQKANQFKASYHSVEHGLLNYLYLGWWVNRKPVTLYFNIKDSKSGDALYPIPVEMLDARLTEIKINNNVHPLNISSSGSISLPELKDAEVVVTLVWNPH